MTGCRSWFVACLLPLSLWVQSWLKSGDFHDAENRQLPCRMIMRHVKNPLTACLSWVLSAKLNSQNKVRIIRAQVPPSGEENGSQNCLQ
ncbi:hypothetical protein TNCV_1345671 [Trichonephila clavipes]|nr:hypothetical protein TNCV_1345671 [Trichonephila clavipes]